MEIRLLGPVEVWAGGRQLQVGSAQLRLALAALAVDAGRPVPVEALIDRVWGQHQPAAVRAGVHTRITHLRQLLATAADADAEADADADADQAPTAAAEPAGSGGTGELVLRPGGYALQVDPDAVDLQRFRRLAAAAQRPERSDAERVALLDEALGLWRGAPLAGLTGEWAARMRDRWRPERLDAVLDWGRAAVRLGQHTRVIPTLRGLAEDYPLSEQLAVVLARALVAAGRRDEAAAHLETVCERLVSELGTDPGPELRTVQQAVLADAPLPPLPAPRAPRAPGATRGAIPAQLPGDVLGFTGRTEHLARLDSLLESGPDQAPTTMVITAVSGTAGVGKTALAVHWAHRVAARFPDGQLYVNLRGFDPGGQITDPATAVRGFLDALGVPAERIPPDPDAQAALYRSVVADKRLLVVLDNARDAEHARPLLPGTGTAAVVVTSRNSLAGLVAVDGAHRLALDLLSTVEARELLAHRLGRDRVAAEPDAVDRVIAACARLPLALAVAAARVQQTTFPVATLAAELADAGGRLDTLDVGDPASHVRAVFSWSYATLTAPAARLFRLLGLHPGADISTPAAASLAGLPPAQVRPLLAELVRAGLLGEQTPDRYAFHDLLRAYATDLVDTVDTEPDRDAATVRLLDHYIHSAHTADRRVDTARDPMPVPLTPPAPGTSPEHPADPEAALSWLSAERPVLLAVQRLAADAGRDVHAWQLAWALHSVLDRQGRWHELIGTWQTALPAADRLPHPAGASAHRVLGAAVTRLADHESAHHHLQHALRLYTEAADPVGQAYAHIDLAMLWDRQEQPDRALEHAQQSLTLYQAAGHRRGQTDALNAVGWCYTMLGEPLQALTYCQQALTLYQQLGDQVGEAATLDSLGYAHHHLDQHAAAADCYQRALTLIRDLGDRYYEATILTHLGDTHHAAGQPDQARTAWTAALDILTDLDHPEADGVRAKLADLD